MVVNLPDINLAALRQVITGDTDQVEFDVTLSASGGSGSYTYNVLKHPRNGTLVVDVALPDLTFTVTTTDFVGRDSLQFVASDGYGLTDVNEVVFVVLRDPSAAEITRIRNLIEDNGTPPNFTDPAITAQFQIAARYSYGTETTLINTAIGLVSRLLADATARVSYRQYEISENLSDLVKNYNGLLDYLRSLLETAEFEELGQTTTGAASVQLTMQMPSTPRRSEWVNYRR